MSRWSQRVRRRRWVSTPLFIAQILFALFLVELSWSIYADFLREHRYGLSEQSFFAWLRDQTLIAVVKVADP